MSRSALLLIPIAALLAGCGQTGNLTLPDKKPAPRPTAATRPVQPAASPQPPVTAPSPTPADDQDPAAKKDGNSPQP